MCARVCFRWTYDVPQLVPPTAEGYSQHRRAVLSIKGLLAFFVNSSCNTDARFIHSALYHPSTFKECTRSGETEPLTDGDGVDGVGVAVIVAVVVILPAVPTGHHKDAAKAASTCNHSVLQSCL